MGQMTGEIGEPLALPERPRAVLGLLLLGHSKKQVATALSLNQHTIDRQVRVLHRHFKVRSRGQLLARAASAPPPPRRNNVTNHRRPIRHLALFRPG